MSAMSRRSFLQAGATAGLVVPAAGGGLAVLLSGARGVAATAPPSSEPAGEWEAVSQTFMTPLGFSTSFVHILAAKEEGFWESEGLDIDIQAGQGTSTAIQALLTDSAGYADGGGITSTIAICNEDVPIVHIATTRQKGATEVVSLPDSPLRTGADLEGKRIGVASSGGGTETILDLIAVNAGVDPGSISRPVTGTGSAAYQLAVQGDVDGWMAINTDRAAIEEAEGIELVHFNPDDELVIPTQSIMAPLDFVDDDANAEVLVRFASGLYAAMHWVLDPANHEAAIEHVRTYNPEVPAEVGLAQLPLVTELWTARDPDKLLELLPDQWDQGQDTLIAAGLISERVPVERLIRTDFVTAAKAG